MKHYKIVEGEVLDTFSTTWRSCYRVVEWEGDVCKGGLGTYYFEHHAAARVADLEGRFVPAGRLFS